MSSLPPFGTPVYGWLTSIERLREKIEMAKTEKFRRELGEYTATYDLEHTKDTELKRCAAIAVERYRKEKEQQRACAYANDYEYVHKFLQGWAHQRRIHVHRTSKGHIHYQGIKFMDADGKRIGQSQSWDTVDGTIVRQSRDLGTTTIILLMLNQILPTLPEFHDIDLGPTDEKEYHIFEIYMDNRDLYDNFD